MRLSQNFVPTLKEIPNDAVMPSHILMLRAGLMRQLAAGVFSWLPLGYKVLKQVMEVLREEMNEIGGQEFHMPALNPIEIWEETGRVEAMGDVLFHIKNREGLILAPTHEEIITFHAKQHIQSYRDLPQIWYQIQSKFRNEPRPKSGVMRGRQFFMKDAYSLDSTWDGLDISYSKHAEAYKKIFERIGIKFFIVGASSGAMGGKQSQEFMVESDFGEDTCAICEESGYAANIEVATSSLSPIGRIQPNLGYEEFATPNSKTINELVEHFNLDVNRCAKSVVYVVNEKPILILMRGNDELNETKLGTFFKTNNFRPAHPFELEKITGANAGSIGPINLKSEIEIYADNLLLNANGLVSGSNRDGYHFKNIDIERDVTITEYSDFRTILEGEPCPISGKPLRVVRAIELGHIFKLGTKYTEALNAKFFDQDGNENPIIMGSYGIGVERILACYIEQNHDEKGIIWNAPLVPYHVHLISLSNDNNDEVSKHADEIYYQMKNAGYEVLYDDRVERAGVKFNDADLLGMPIQIIAGKKNLSSGNVEIKYRKNGEREIVPIASIIINLYEFFKS